MVFTTDDITGKPVDFGRREKTKIEDIPMDLQPTRKPHLLSLDPSSSAIGYAISTDPDTFTECGVIKPKISKFARYRTKQGITTEAVERIADMRHQLIEVIQQYEPEVTIVELPSGHVHGRNKSKGSGQSIHGMGVGAVLAICWGHCKPMSIQVINANTWTRRTPKERRTARIQQIFPEYDAANDKGGDQADAMGLARWWYAKQLTKGSNRE